MPSPPETRGLNSQGAAMIAVSVVLWLIAAILVALRFVARRGPVRPGIDDWTILVGLILTFFLVICSIIWAAIGGLGEPMNQLSKAQSKKSLEIFFAFQILYTFAVPMVKTSILLLYKRIFSVPHFHNAANLVQLLVIGWFIGTFFSVIFQCSPVAQAWQPTLERNCINIQAFSLGQGISNMLIDVVVLCMPLPMIWNLQMSRFKKISLTGIFLLGGFVCVASIFRITGFRADERNSPSSESESHIFSVVEPCLGIICICAPTVYPLIRGVFQDHALSRQSKSTQKAMASDQTKSGDYVELNEGRLLA